MVGGSPRFDIAPGCLLDGLELAFTRYARSGGLYRRVILLLQPSQPIRPPASFMLLRARDEVLERSAWPVVHPILIFLRGRRVHDTGDMAGARKHEPLVAGEVVHDLPHALRRRDMVFAA